MCCISTNKGLKGRVGWLQKIEYQVMWRHPTVVFACFIRPCLEVVHHGVLNRGRDDFLRIVWTSVGKTRNQPSKYLQLPILSFTVVINKTLLQIP